MGMAWVVLLPRGNHCESGSGAYCRRAYAAWLRIGNEKTVIIHGMNDSGANVALYPFW
jgi:hypothetical protein